jgi:hypothetical protein
MGSLMLTRIGRIPDEFLPDGRAFHERFSGTPVSEQPNPQTANVVDLALGVLLAEPPTVVSRRIRMRRSASLAIAS